MTGAVSFVGFNLTYPLSSDFSFGGINASWTRVGVVYIADRDTTALSSGAILVEDDSSYC